MAELIDSGRQYCDAIFFGFFDIFGKGAAFMGTMLMGISTQLFDTSRAGVGLLAVMFAVGFVLFRMAVRKAEAA